MSGFQDTSLFDRVRREVDLADFAARVTTLGSGKAERRGACPVCGSGTKSKSAPFAVYPEKGKWRCWADCDRGGDVVDLYQALNPGCSAVDAVKALLGGAFEAAARPIKAKAVGPDAGDERRARRAAEMWEGGKPFAGTLGERYLLGRGIAAEVVAAAAPRLRFHPFARHSWISSESRWLTAPAMLAKVESPLGFTGGVHATFLRRDGKGRDKGLGKKMLGPQAIDGIYGAAWLIGPEAEGALAGSPLAVAEGIETVLSMVTLERVRFSAAGPGRMMRACAALSLGRLQGGVLKDADGCIDVDDPQPDPERPAFTWSNGVGDQAWPEVLIGVDRDMSSWKVKGRRRRADRHGERAPLAYIMDAEARARLCARLAVHWWTRAGSDARAIAPGRLADFNNDLMASEARA